MLKKSASAYSAPSQSGLIGIVAAGVTERMIHTNRFIAALAVLLMLSTAAAEVPQVDGNEQIDTVTVEAERVRLERQISAFVTEIARSSRAESLARWQVPICPLVAGLSLAG